MNYRSRKTCSHQQICRDPGANISIFQTTYVSLFYAKFVKVKWFGIFVLTRPKRPMKNRINPLMPGGNKKITHT